MINKRTQQHSKIHILKVIKQLYERVYTLKPERKAYKSSFKKDKEDFYNSLIDYEDYLNKYLISQPALNNSILMKFIDYNVNILSKLVLIPPLFFKTINPKVNILLKLVLIPPLFFKIINSSVNKTQRSFKLAPVLVTDQGKYPITNRLNNDNTVL